MNISTLGWVELRSSAGVFFSFNFFLFKICCGTVFHNFCRGFEQHRQRQTGSLAKIAHLYMCSKFSLFIASNQRPLGY
jgi:hypothetical protein